MRLIIGIGATLYHGEPRGICWRIMVVARVSVRGETCSCAFGVQTSTGLGFANLEPVPLNDGFIAAVAAA
jgi:hypothetical protein